MARRLGKHTPGCISGRVSQGSDLINGLDPGGIIGSCQGVEGPGSEAIPCLHPFPGILSSASPPPCWQLLCSDLCTMRDRALGVTLHTKINLLSLGLFSRAFIPSQKQEGSLLELKPLEHSQRI